MGIKKIEWEVVDWMNLTEDSDKCGGVCCSEHGNEVA